MWNHVQFHSTFQTTHVPRLTWKVYQSGLRQALTCLNNAAVILSTYYNLPLCDSETRTESGRYDSWDINYHVMSSSILELQTGGRTKKNVNSSAGSLQPSKLLYKLKQMAEQYRPKGKHLSHCPSHNKGQHSVHMK